MTQVALNLVQKMFPSVTKVIDGKSDIHVEVNKRDASSKAVRDHKECALAQACRRTLDLDGAIISRSVAYLIKGRTATRYRVPSSATREIIAFDRGAAFVPGDYMLKRVPKPMRFGEKRSGGKTKPPKRKNRRPVFRHVTEGIRSSLLES